MTPALLSYLCDAIDRSPLELRDAQRDTGGAIASGRLLSPGGREYPIRNGIPRFAGDAVHLDVASFGDEWNYFNFDDFRVNWTEQSLKNTFGSLEVFSGRTVVDAGGGSGIQSRWIKEAGARHVICLELSHSVDGVVTRNLSGVSGVDVIQCSIDQPPLRDGSIDGIVLCHNVIQHTSSVEQTARALWRLVAPGGEFAFNCYAKNDKGTWRKLRLALSLALRRVLSRRSFLFRLNYAGALGALRMVPVFGWLMEKSLLVIRGDVPPGPNYGHRANKSAVLNTFDFYGAHTYQHLKSDDEIRALVRELQPDPLKVLNADRYFLRPPPVGIALRLKK